jgi:uncharacterized protein YjbJ (UPF0337 family)
VNAFERPGGERLQAHESSFRSCPRLTVSVTVASTTGPAAGALKEAAGKALGDAKLVAEGKDDKVEGKIQNAVGGVKDVLKEAVNK